jgi:FkbM family methyltransferase
MKRPLIMRAAPPRLRSALYYRFFHPAPPRWRGLFEDAQLSYAPRMRMRLVATDVFHGAIAFTGFYELALSRRVAQLADEGGLFIDVGANAGYFSLLWAAAHRDNRVIALEPSARNLALLRENLARNGVADQVEVSGVAAGRAEGTLDFILGDTSQTGWGGFTLERTADSVEVPVRRLDSLLQSDRRVELLKIDVEGAEAWVIEGCARLLQQKQIHEIRFEQNAPRMRQLGIDPHETLDLLGTYGYSARPIGKSSAPQTAWVATPS